MSRRIALVLRDLVTGGAQSQYTVLAEQLASRGHTVTVIAFRPGGMFWDRLLAHPDIEVHALTPGRIVADRARLLFRLERYLRAWRPHAVYSDGPGSNLYNALAARGRWAVLWGLHGRPVPTPRVWLALDRACALISHRADVIIGNSRFQVTWHLNRGYKPRRIEVVPNGIDVELFRPDEERRARQRGAWKIQDEKVVGIVGRLAPVKDHETFLRAASVIRAARPDVRFVVVGPDEQGRLQELRALVGELDLDSVVRFVGNHEAVHEAYPAMDVHALTSVSESLPNAVLEAMACGVPVVSTDVGDVRELVGDAGIVVPVGDFQAVAEGVLNCLSRVNGVGLAGRARVEALCSIEALAVRMESIIESSSAHVGSVVR